LLAEGDGRRRWRWHLGRHNVLKTSVIPWPGMPYHPKAYLTRKRNVRPGLDARTKILKALEEEPGLTMAQIADRTGLSYSSVRLHLASLEREGVVARKGKRPYTWFLTGLGQARLTDF